MTIPLRLVATALVVGLFPLLGLAALIVDVVRARPGAHPRRPWMATRLLAFLCVYLAAEIVGLAALFAAWLFAGLGRSRARRILGWTFAVQHAWTGALFRATCSIFDLTLRIEGERAIGEGALLVFMRHTSIVDTLLPHAILGGHVGRRLRFVLKRELLADPCLDVAGLRLPNAFVARGGFDSDVEIAKVRHLTEGLGPRDAIIIYPEGTRFSRAKQARALDKLKASDPEGAVVLGPVEHVLPPKVGGPLALLEGSDADVLFFAHTGLEGFAEIGDIFRGAMVGRTVQVRLWRVERADIPKDAKGRGAWLHREWRELDAWVRRAKA